MYDDNRIPDKLCTSNCKYPPTRAIRYYYTNLRPTFLYIVFVIPIIGQTPDFFDYIELRFLFTHAQLATENWCINSL